MNQRASATTLEPETSSVEREALLGILEKSRLTGTHLEIGTAAGGTLCQMMLTYDTRRRPRFVVVDPLGYFPKQREIIERNLSAAGIDPATVEFRQMSSHEAAKKADTAGDRFSFIFIDAVHDAFHVTQDLAWVRMLDVGGIAAFHDYSYVKFPGVVWAIDRFLSRNKNYKVISRAGTMLIVEKTALSRCAERRTLDLPLAAIADVLLKWRRSARRRLAELAG